LGSATLSALLQAQKQHRHNDSQPTVILWIKRFAQEASCLQDCPICQAVTLALLR